MPESDMEYYSHLRQNMQRNSKYAVQGNYTTALPAQEEAMFRQWIEQNKVPFNPQDPITDYDMRGFWKALQSKDPRAVNAIDPHDKKLHYPDIWKTPYHDTFSADSQWAMPNAPQWTTDGKLIDMNGAVLFDPTKGSH